MIEIICNKEDSDKSAKNPKDNSTCIRRPKNIKQIGDVSSDKKIYIEDYAFTYINSIAYNNPKEEQAGVLLGELAKEGRERCVFVKGVIKAVLNSASREGIYFDEAVWNKIYSDIEKYFPDLTVVGWFAVIPELTDEQKGYVCFYERNYEMQEYMLERSEKKSCEDVRTDRVVKNIRNVIRQKEEFKEQKRGGGFMYGISAFLVVVIIVIGINLMNNYERMKKLNQSVNNLMNQLEEEAGDRKSKTAGVDSDAANIKNADDSGTDGEAIKVNKLSGEVYPLEENSTQADTKQNGTQEINTGADSGTNQAGSVTTDEETAKTAASRGQGSDDDATDSAGNAQYSDSEAAGSVYTVKSGDTLMGICKQHYGTTTRYKEVMHYNGLADSDILHIGQEIRLPD